MFAASRSRVHECDTVVVIENTRTQNKMKEHDNSERLVG